MRLAGEIPIDILQLIAVEDTSSWPSIKDAKPAAPHYRYDDHMKEIVPNIPARIRRA